MPKIMLIHGVHYGDGFDYPHLKLCEALNLMPFELHLHKWAGLLDSSKLDLHNWLSEKVIRLFCKFAGWVDFADDVVSYLLDKKTRDACLNDLEQELVRVKPRVVVAHSLGSVLVWQLFQKRTKYTPQKIIFIGSPLWFEPLRWVVGNQWINVPQFVSYSGNLDPVTGFGKAWGRNTRRLFGVTHDLLAYCKKLKVV